MDNGFSFPPVLAPGMSTNDIKEFLCIQAAAIVVREIANRIYPDIAEPDQEHTKRINRLRDAIQNVKQEFMTLTP